MIRAVPGGKWSEIGEMKNVDCVVMGSALDPNMRSGRLEYPNQGEHPFDFWVERPFGRKADIEFEKAILNLASWWITTWTL